MCAKVFSEQLYCQNISFQSIQETYQKISQKTKFSNNVYLEVILFIIKNLFQIFMYFSVLFFYLRSFNWINFKNI